MRQNKKSFDHHEKEIVEAFEKGEFHSSEDAMEERQYAEAAAKNYMKRQSRINIRLSEADLNMVKRLAVQEGLPYQTFIASVIHKLVSGQLREYRPHN